MKNKKWIREAKKIKGHCSNKSSVCSDDNGKIICPYYNRCTEITCLIPPRYMSLNDLKTICKKLSN